MNPARDNKGRFIKVVANLEPAPMAPTLAQPPQDGKWHTMWICERHNRALYDFQRCPACVAEEQEHRSHISRLTWRQRAWLWFMIRFGR